MLVDSERGRDFSHNIRIRRPTIERKATRCHGSSALKQQRAAFVASGRCVFHKRFQETTAFTNILSTLQQHAAIFSTKHEINDKRLLVVGSVETSPNALFTRLSILQVARRVLICARVRVSARVARRFSIGKTSVEEPTMRYAAFHLTPPLIFHSSKRLLLHPVYIEISFRRNTPNTRHFQQHGDWNLIERA